MKFRDFIDVRDGTHDSPKSVSGIGYPLVTTKHLGNGFIDLSNTNNISEEDYIAINKRSKVDQFDILISMIGTVGSVYQERQSQPGYAIKNVGLLKFNGDETLSNYVYYWLKSSNGQNEIKVRLKGTTQQFLSLTELRNLTLELPSREEMNLAVKPLMILDQKMYSLGSINDNLLELGRSYYQNFVDTHDTEGQMVSTIAESVITGKTPSTKDESNYGDDVPFVTIPDMHSQIFTTKTTRSLSKKGADSQVKKYLLPFTLSVSSIGTPGLVTINPEESQTNQQINSVIAEKEKIWYLFLAFDSLKAHIENLGSGGSTILNLNKSNFEKIDIDWPIDKSALIEFNTVIEPIFMNILNNQREINSLSMVRDTLISELI